MSSIYDGAFCEIIKGWKELTIFDKNSILDVRQGSEYAPAV